MSSHLKFNIVAH